MKRRKELKKLKKSKNLKTEDEFLPKQSLIIWIFVYFFLLSSFALCAVSLYYQKIIVDQEQVPPLPTGISCNLFVTCENSLDACLVGDWNWSCSAPRQPRPTNNAANCSLIYLDNLSDVSKIPLEAVKFAQIVEINNPNTPLPGSAAASGMTNAEMQVAVDWWCELIYKYVKCSCTACSVCTEPQDVCAINDPKFWCRLHLTAGFADAPIYNATTPYFNYTFMSQNSLNSQKLLVSPTYRLQA